MNVKNYEIKLKVLSPLHIGSGETLNPLRYVVKNNILYYLNESQYIRELLKTPNSHLEQVVKTDNIYNIVNYFVDCFDETNTDTWQHSYKVDNQFQQAFDKNLKSPDNQNNLFEFYRTDLFKTPVIPGSSIKGCFRTVMLSAMQRKLKIEDVMEVVGDGKEKPNSQKTEAKILGNLSVKITEKAGKKLTQTSIDVAKDPFKYIKISDIAVGTSAMTVKKIFNKKNNTDEGIPYYAEMLNKGDLVYSGTMSIDSRFDIEIARILGTEPVNTFEYFLKSAKEYYSRVIRKDHDWLETIKKVDTIREIILRFSELGGKPNAAIFRLGKGQGCHSLALKPLNQSPRSRNLAGWEPIGWVQIEFNEI